MFIYEKKLQFPVKIQRPNPRLASIIISQYGGPDGELGASLRYLSQRYSMPFDEQKGLLTDIGVEELGHLEMVGALVHQLTRNLKDSEIENTDFAPYFVDHTSIVMNNDTVINDSRPITDLGADFRQPITSQIAEKGVPNW